ncbi:hypothetical protein BY996DRAFT_6409286 [Phakopsora pachyrhizi]|uniref:Uncharacterized protein n=1 Tax=Phakopsora pachyrhizi TaxID=170000 RepID=A0AAV0AW35_PHAPC|nr:hypothetical protein BY996DRAFT_6409286 [Phakopsora pachyrhizi]CAH7672119.1 hypothetical protein PPACK8108_LOCUS6906 [Phakopsora pachyrhizi]
MGPKKLSTLWVAFINIYLVVKTLAVDLGNQSNGGGTDHKVTVGAQGLAFDPPSITAKKGDTVTFVFFQNSHSVTQTHFKDPCAGYSPPSENFCSVTSASGSNPYPNSGTPPPDLPTPPSNNTTTVPDNTAPPKQNDQYPTQPIPVPTTPDTVPSTPTSPFGGNGSTQPGCICPQPNSYPASEPPKPEVTSSEQPNVPETPQKPSVTSGEQPSTPDPPKQPSVSSGGEQTTNPVPQTCDAKCIEVSGSCQISPDCDLQGKSPADTKCKMEDGKCKRCGENKRMRRSMIMESAAGESKNFRRDLKNTDFIPENSEKAEGTEETTQPAETKPSNTQETSGVNQGTADAPTGVKSGGAGLDSGVVNVDEASKSTGITWKITISDDSKPLWFMSAAPNECSSGMVFTINAATSGEKTFDAFVKAAKDSTCPQPYPSSTNLQGDGAVASSPPSKCSKGEEKPPVTSGEENNNSTPSNPYPTNTNPNNSPANPKPTTDATQPVPSPPTPDQNTTQPPAKTPQSGGPNPPSISSSAQVPYNPFYFFTTPTLFSFLLAILGLNLII